MLDYLVICGEDAPMVKSSTRSKVFCADVPTFVFDVFMSVLGRPQGSGRGKIVSRDYVAFFADRVQPCLSSQSRSLFTMPKNKAGDSEETATQPTDGKKQG